MNNFKKHFPIFSNIDISYLDSAATTQKPNSIIESIDEYYTLYNANAGRSSHELSMKSKSIIENTREKVKSFLNCGENGEVVFTKNCTESINIVASSYAAEFLEKGDEILLAITNHHANIVPWQVAAKKKSLILKYIYIDEEGRLDIDDFKYKLNSKTKIVALSSAVNTTGIIQDFRRVIKLAHKVGAKVLLDCAQSIAHFKHDVNEWDVDFLCFSGHKMYSAYGVGILYAKKELLDKMPPFIYGGDMIEYVEEQASTYAISPYKFEGGTQNAAAIYSLSRAIDYIETLGYAQIEKITNALFLELMFKLKKLDYLELYYSNDKVDRLPIICFNVRGVHSHDTAFILDNYGVAIRSGQHCTAPLHKFMNVNSTCRISLNIYNTSEDIDRIIKALNKVAEVFNV